MAGLIAGDGTTSDGVHEGAAPDANVVSVKVAGWDGATDVTTVIGALQWVVSHRARYGIRVVNLSWGTDSLQPAAVDPLNAAVQRAWRAGLVVVVSAGNRGSAPVTKPADDPFVITVGAADTAGTADRDDDAPAAFSSHGGGKPDLLAPGVSMVSDRAPGSTIDTFSGPEARLGTGLFKGTGTSQAAAVVSGVVARMLSASPGLTPDEVKAALLRSADGRLAGPAGGAGMVDAAGAVDFAVDNGVPPRRRAAGAVDGAWPARGQPRQRARRRRRRRGRHPVPGRGRDRRPRRGVGRRRGGERRLDHARLGALPVGPARLRRRARERPGTRLDAARPARRRRGRRPTGARARPWTPAGTRSTGARSTGGRYWGARYWGSVSWG